MHEDHPHLSHRRRVITEGDLAFIRRLIAEHPGSSRLALSKKLCQAWNWVQPNGALRDMVCRSLMLKLHREGHIELPPVRHVPPNPLARRVAPALVPVDQAELQMSLGELGSIELRQVRRTDQERVFNSLLQQYHYLGYTQPVGEHLKYLMVARPSGGASAGQERPIACAAWSSAPRHLGSRDRHIGWSAAARRANIGLLAYNTRFLVLPWVRVPHLASHLLGRMARVIAADWQRLYGHPVVWLETFIDPQRFAGTCYRAANWVELGLTTGRGKDDQTHRANRPVKQVLGYALQPNWRQRLQAVPAAVVGEAVAPEA